MEDVSTPHQARLSGTSWDPQLYLKFMEFRVRPAIELLERVPTDHPAHVYDIGCGPGHITRLLSNRWPDATICGVDNSDEMLRAATDLAPEIEFVRADLDTWMPGTPADVIFANSVFHLIGDHDKLLPRLLGALAPQGVLAAQMPDCYDAPWYQLMCETLMTAGHGGSALGTQQLRDAMSVNSVHTPEFYHRLLSDRVGELDIWTTEYLQVLDGDDPVYAWIKAAGLRPVLNTLPPDDLGVFLGAYLPELRKAYPKMSSGQTLFPFRRTFMVARAT
ncbi:trans-aconitate 2-methyltransferase [Streptomyces albospinus]|uniref:Trans-aconitate 2-methyltransferase n=1 Tax=Streptomyces albospinus TaxID=285515 RepID=A0ABQ2VMX1_9ACTN|nr:methyltransferase domain-containing protein [Streptomyces albospinus]GGU93896.1 trans-aconitate 2-methyltransferase [Streptomyces albospinus]